MGFRAFVAVPVPPEPPVVALLDALAALRADVKVVEATALHVTLSFLGQVDLERRPALEAALLVGAKGFAPFEAELRAVGAFPNARHPRVVWAGVRDPKPMVALALRVREELARAGFAQDEKDFRAHLTLARVRSPRGEGELATFLRQHAADELATIPIREVVLLESTTSPTGPKYEALARTLLEA